MVFEDWRDSSRFEIRVRQQRISVFGSFFFNSGNQLWRWPLLFGAATTVSRVDDFGSSGFWGWRLLCRGGVGFSSAVCDEVRCLMGRLGGLYLVGGTLSAFEEVGGWEKVTRSSSMAAASTLVPSPYLRQPLIHPLLTLFSRTPQRPLLPYEPVKIS